MTKKKKKSKLASFLKILLLAILIVITVVLIYEHFRTPILQATQTVVEKAEKAMEHTAASSVKEVYADLELPAPITNKDEQIIRHTGYTVSYNQAWRLPNWVAYELTREETKGTATRTNKFITDPMVKGVSASNRDYSHSGFDRGHMAPAGDMTWSSTAMKESFYFSNMCPQVPGLNRGRWKDLEEQIREWAAEDSALVIVCGPLIDKKDSTIGKNRIAVPHAFFKVILAPYVSSPRAIGFIFKNEKDVSPLRSYTATVDSVESLTGIDFFPALPDKIENHVEAQCTPSDWGI